MDFDDFLISEMSCEKKTLLLVIYDISDDKKRVKIAKYLQGYGYRVQKSAFEIRLKPSRYPIFLKMLKQQSGGMDNIRIYKIQNVKDITCYGADYSKDNITADIWIA